MKRNIICIWLLLALWLAKEARAQQVPEISYDKARSFRSERIFLEPDSSNVERYANRVAFLDGFGKEYVAIDVQGSPIAGYDIPKNLAETTKNFMHHSAGSVYSTVACQHSV